MPATTKYSSRYRERKWTNGPCLGPLTVGEEADTKAGSNPVDTGCREVAGGCMEST